MTVNDRRSIFLPKMRYLRIFSSHLLQRKNSYDKERKINWRHHLSYHFHVEFFLLVLLYVALIWKNWGSWMKQDLEFFNFFWIRRIRFSIHFDDRRIRIREERSLPSKLSWSSIKTVNTRGSDAACHLLWRDSLTTPSVIRERPFAQSYWIGY